MDGDGWVPAANPAASKAAIAAPLALRGPCGYEIDSYGMNCLLPLPAPAPDDRSTCLFDR
jgi:hypothetical protein